MKGLLKAFGILALVCLSAFLGYEAFKVRDIVVVGLVNRPPGEAVALSGIQAGESMFLVDKQAAQDGINSHPYYICREIKINWPDSVTITLEERQVKALILHMNSLIAIDGEGLVLELDMYSEGAQAPVVTGFATSSFIVGKEIAAQEEAQLLAVKTILKALDEAGYAYAVSEINVANVLDLKLVTAEGIICLLGTSLDIETKIEWIRAVIPRLIVEYPDITVAGGELDVSSGSSASFLPAEYR